MHRTVGLTGSIGPLTLTLVRSSVSLIVRCIFISARQHICYSALYAIARPSVGLSVTRIIIIIIMTHRQLWSVATTLHGVHVPPHSATSVSLMAGVPSPT